MNLIILQPYSLASGRGFLFPAFCAADECPVDFVELSEWREEHQMPKATATGSGLTIGDFERLGSLKN